MVCIIYLHIRTTPPSQKELLPQPIVSAQATSKSSAPPSTSPAAVLAYVRRLDASANEYDKRVKRAELAIVSI
jgi:hypothetical protein